MVAVFQLGVTGIVQINAQPHRLVEVDEELLRGVKGFGGWVSLLYQNILSNVFHSNISNILQKIYMNKRGKPESAKR